MVITSRKNELITRICKLKDKKHRDATGLFLLCGKKLLGEAISSDIKIKYIFAVEKNKETAEKAADLCGAELFYTSEDVFSRLTDEQSPDGICAVAEIPKRVHTIEDGSFVLICDSLSDPGNAGAVLRSARAFGAGTVIFSAGCADIYSQKVLRGAMGAVFKNNVITGADTESVIAKLRQRGFRVYAAALHTDAVPLKAADLSGGCAVVIGNEGHGLSKETVSACDGALFIEMEPLCESLNAAVAASVILYKRYTEG
jgi:TrmH family RNA methyltransferase